FVDFCKRDHFLKIFSMGLGLSVLFIGVGISMHLANSIGPDINSNWDNAWDFLKTQTPELSIVGTWWDPGHMIAGLAERRNFADGAHCAEPCMYNINDRIVDLGRIMATDNEAESLELIKKYQGDSPKVYWIASDDLVSKYQWLQYFGMGCDARSDQKCSLYYQLPKSDIKYDSTGQPIAVQYSDVLVIPASTPIPIYTQGKTAAIIQEVIYYDVSGQVRRADLTNVTDFVKQYETELKINLQPSTLTATAWISRDYSYIVMIPANLRNTVFTRMYFLEGAGLEHFKQVFRNEQVKIYEVV
ncbi:MAG: hypothetical protein PHU12_04100, partial [Candidatus Aenigmarchaeota archaeon]|nr:hypothetical protein [Candidatus Aenigmarchaeota archaeon]